MIISRYAQLPMSKATIWAVIVVPMLAPKITATAAVKVMRPAFTKPTSITVVTLLLWMMAVKPAPTAAPAQRLLVRVSRVFCSLPPARV